jgi:hypothetical protein
MLIPMRAYPQIESVEGAFVSSTPRRAAQLKNRGDHARATAGVAAPSRKGERRIHEKREGNGRVVDQDGLTCMRLCTGLWRVSGTTPAAKDDAIVESTGGVLRRNAHADDDAWYALPPRATSSLVGVVMYNRVG